ncbi:hypothetical protein GFS24_03225 [Chitinophaga sp. SYP-B3965]|uniref:hypothetical protein n=1 Tax=Chitinophaga sp. SYP-B3965 TaxID=2663120 RepID=UPI001299B34F|nr:hypothetical protein [Chitinophaga sp. SYP-B3965]MRG44106.1 hypothetical protein [Chitinophaga sp. SYP-B3965]
MKTTKIINLAGILMALAIIISGCYKQEPVFNFIEKPVPGPPPPPPLSNDLKNVTLNYNGAVLKTSMIAQRTFDPYSAPSAFHRYRTGFELALRLDDNNNIELYQKLQVQIPINEKGEPVPGKYTIKNNVVTEGGDMNIKYTKGIYSDVFPDANFKTGKDKFIFDMALRLEVFDTATHEVAGYIDELIIQDKSNLARKVIFKDLGFTLNYNHMEIFLNDTLAFEGATDANSMWYYGNGLATLNGASSASPFIMASMSFNITEFTGVGSYTYKTNTDDLSYGPSANISMNEGTGIGDVDGYLSPAIFPVDDHTIKVETYIENVLIKGTLSAAKAQLWGNNTGGYYPSDLIATRPPFKLTGSFFQRQL